MRSVDTGAAADPVSLIRGTHTRGMERFDDSIATLDGPQLLALFERGDEHSAGLDPLVMSDGTWRPDGFDSDVKSTAGDVRDYLAQWVEEQS